MSSNNDSTPPTSTQAIRDAFVKHFTQLDHTLVQSSSLVPKNDNTLLFTNAGMVQFKDVFLGHATRPYKRAVTIQRCVRAGGKHNDLENVGYTARHHTFFEMLGNFSFGDYFKKTAIEYAWSFLTEVLRLPKERLWITVFEKDDESAAIWINDIGIDPSHLSRCGADDNFWAMGETGPCGPCTEIFYDHDPTATEVDDDRRVEIWNLVFMQFNRTDDGELLPLPKPSVDTGMGLERIAAVMQGVRNNYDIDLFQHLIGEIAKQCKTKTLDDPSLRVIADHIRSTSFLILDNVIPANEGRGYVLRRIIRRAIRHAHKLGARQPFLHKLVEPLVKIMGAAYPELSTAKSSITSIIKQEELSFAKTLEKGLAIFEKELSKISSKKIIPGELAFLLYDTYGFPLDLTADIARERGYSLDEVGFNKAMEKQRKQSKASDQFTADYYTLPSISVETTKFTGYEHLTSKGIVLALFDENNAPVKNILPGQTGIVVLDTTPFYAEGGGQVGDVGTLTLNEGITFDVKNTRKQGGVYFHQGKCLPASAEKSQAGIPLQLGDAVNAEVNCAKRRATEYNHSATHLLHAALRELFGKQLIQQGSLVDPERLRFDFSYPQPLTQTEIAAVEHLVNQKIRENLPRLTETMNIDEAKARGAIALFDEKYTEQVRVLSFGDFSIELCGGTHVRQTGEIGCFKITAESGVATGVRRIEALTGEGVFNWIQARNKQIEQAAKLLKSSESHWLEKLKQTVQRVKELEKIQQQFQAKLASNKRSSLHEAAVEINGIHWVAAELSGANLQTLRNTVDQLKQNFKKAAIILASVDNGRVLLVAGVSKNCIEKVTAPQLLNHVAAQVDGKGGGRPDMAQGGGNTPEKLAAALASVEGWARGQGVSSY